MLYAVITCSQLSVFPRIFLIYLIWESLLQRIEFFLFGSHYICYKRLCYSVWLYYITVEYFHSNCMCVSRIHAISFIKRLHGHLLIGWLRAPQRYIPQRHTQWKLTMFSLTPPLIYKYVSTQSFLTNTFNTFTHTCRRGGNSRRVTG